VHDAQSLVSQAPRFNQILLDYGFDVAGRHAVQVEDVGDGNGNRVVQLETFPDIGAELAHRLEADSPVEVDRLAV
jgi:hypothetical protein